VHALLAARLLRHVRQQLLQLSSVILAAACWCMLLRVIPQRLLHKLRPTLAIHRPESCMAAMARP
jgi:hypothetical protein